MPKRFTLSIVLLVITAIIFAFSFKKFDYSKAKNMNVCKSLKGEVLVYYIFVDTKTTTPWTQFDIQSTNDSINVALKWIREKAREKNIELKIKSDYYIGPEFSTIKKDLTEKSVETTIQTPNLKTGLENLNKWADFIAKKTGETFDLTQKDGIPDIKNPKNKERLVAYLRDEYKVESVALLYLVNNYYKTDISVYVNSFDTDNIEFAVVSYKYPSAIAHSILNLFGAADLYESPYRRNEKNITFAEQEFPNDIMQDPYAKNIFNLTISPFTEYLIGWNDSLDSKYSDLLYDKGIKLK